MGEELADSERALQRLQDEGADGEPMANPQNGDRQPWLDKADPTRRRSVNAACVYNYECVCYGYTAGRACQGIANNA